MLAYYKMPPPRKLQQTANITRYQRRVLRSHYNIRRATTERYRELRTEYNQNLPAIKREYKNRQIVSNLVSNIFTNVRRTQAQEARARQVLRRGLRRRNISILDWEAYVEQRLANLDSPFVFEITSASVLGVKRQITFKNFHQFRNWVNRILEQQIEGDSESITVYRDIIGQVGDVFQTSRINILPVVGGCSKCGRKEQQELTFTAGRFNLYNPIVKHNNCGFACVERLLNIKLNYANERKKHNLKYEDMIAPEIIKKVYFEYSDKSKFLCIIDRDYSGDILLQRYDYIMFNKNHYRVIDSAVERPTKDKDGKHIKVKRGLLAFDFETRVIDPLGVGVKTGQSYRRLMADSICSVHYYRLKERVPRTETYTTTDLREGRSARQFLDFLQREHTKNQHYTCVAHNGSRFDFLILQSVMTDEEKLHTEFQYRGYSIIGMNYYNHIFRDPCCFLVGSLDRLCKAFKVSNAKMTENIYNGMDNKQLCFYKPDLDLFEFLELQKSEPEYWSKYVEYCEVDCISLMELWEKFASETKRLIKQMGASKNQDGDWLVQKCSLISKTTIGSLAKKIVDTLNPRPYAKKKCKHDNMAKYLEFVGEDIEKYQFVCCFKRGGISHCNQSGRHDESVSSVDITSQYPASMTNMIIPAGESKWVERFDSNLYGYYHITDLKFNNDYKFRPICAYREGVLDWTTDWSIPETETYVDSEMIKYLIRYNGLTHFKVLKGLVSRNFVLGKHLFGKYISTLFEEKARQDTLKGTDEYNPAMREVCKLFMNSMSGKLVEDPSKYFQLVYTPEPINKRDNIDGIGFNRELSEQVMNDWVGAGVMVYSYSKRNLWEYIRLLPNQSNDIIHIETDGIYFPTKHREYLEEQVKNYKGSYPIAFGNDLGNVKYEHESVGSSYWLGKKFYYMNCKNEGDVLKIKGVPLKTIDKEGTEVKIVTPQSYVDYYEGKPLRAEFQTIFKKVFGQIELSALTMTRELRPDTSKFKLYK